MTTFIDTFLIKLEHYLKDTPAAKDQIAQAGNKDIFEACLNYLETHPTFNFEQKITLMDYRVSYNHSLEAARAGKLKLSSFWLKKADELPPFDDPLLQKIVTVNKMPATAYHLYKEGDHSQAIALLHNTIKLFGELVEKEGMDYMVWGQMEDYINIFRAYCSQKNKKMSIAYGKAILFAALHGKQSTGLLENISVSILMKAEIDFVSYATAEILQRLLKFEDLELKEVFFQVFLPLLEIEDWTHSPFPNYKNALLTLQYSIKNQPTLFLQELQQLLPNFYAQPNILQYFILEALIPLLAQQLDVIQQEKFVGYILHYYTHNLGFKRQALNQSNLNTVMNL